MYIRQQGSAKPSLHTTAVVVVDKDGGEEEKRERPLSRVHTKRIERTMREGRGEGGEGAGRQRANNQAAQRASSELIDRLTID